MKQEVVKSLAAKARGGKSQSEEQAHPVQGDKERETEFKLREGCSVY